MQLCCNALKLYSNKKEKASKKASCEEYHPSSLYNDPKNTRGPEGKIMVRRTNTTCAVKKELAAKCSALSHGIEPASSSLPEMDLPITITIFN